MITPVSNTTRFTQESSSSISSISLSERPLAATRLSILANSSSSDFGLAWARQAVSNAAFILRSRGSDSKTEAMLSGRSRVTVFIYQIYNKLSSSILAFNKIYFQVCIPPGILLAQPVFSQRSLTNRGL